MPVFDPVKKEMLNSNLQALMSEYDANCDHYQLFAKKIETLIFELLSRRNVSFHKIESRTKNRESFQKKISRLDKIYSSLNDVKDVCGIRIITLLENQTDIIAEIIERDFDVDLDHSVDKRKLLAPDSFGYLSLHYVCHISQERTKLAEYNDYSKIPIEIQIRSVLQHAWAEIEHDLGYKTSFAIPRDLRRKFSRVAGLLEIADEEFVEVHQKLTEYKDQVADNIANCSNAVMVDSISLQTFVQSSALVKEIDQKLADEFNIDVKSMNAQDYYDHHTKCLHLAGIHTIGDLESELSLWAEKLIAFILVYDSYRISTDGSSLSEQKQLPEGRSIVLLPYLRILGSSVPDVVRLQNLKDFFRGFEGGNYVHGLNPEKKADDRATYLSRKLFDEYQKATKLRS